MAGRWMHCTSLLLLVAILLLSGCGDGLAATEAPAPTPTPGARFLMPTPGPPATEPPLVPTPEMLPYIVQEGDTLSDIAQRYGVDLDKLIEVNNLQDPNRLSVGQKLWIPVPLEPTATPSP